MKLVNAILLATGALATPLSEPGAVNGGSDLTKRDEANPGCEESPENENWFCWSACNQDTGEPDFKEEWKDGEPWCWLVSSDYRLYTCAAEKKCRIPAVLDSGSACLGDEPPKGTNPHPPRGGCGVK